jgi:Ca-activated chloride channel family protein
MKIDFDDPRWTAYVLGELNAEDRRAVEMALESSEELRLFVEELQIAAFAMKDAMAGEASLGLTFQQRAVVRAAAEGKAGVAPVREKAWFRQPFVWATAGLAAAGLIVMVAPSVWRSKTAAPVDIAQREVENNPSKPGATETANKPPAPAVSEKSGVAGNTANTADKAVAVRPEPGPSEPAPSQARSFANDLRENQQAANARQRQAQSAEVDSKSLAAPERAQNAADQVVAPAPAAGAVSALRGNLGGFGGGGGGARGGRGGGGPGIADSPFAPPTTGTGTGGGIGSGQGSGVGPAAQPAAPSFVAPNLPPLQFSLPAPASVIARVAPPPPLTSSGIASIVPNPGDPNSNRVERANTESYELLGDNPFVYVNTPALQVATFSSDVDTASYSNVRRFINSGQLPPRAAVRIEELINYFSYDYPKASSDHPITANIEAAAAPWNPEHRLVRIGIKAKDAQVGDKPSNLVFLIDVSGSMEPSERLPLLKTGLRMLVERLTENDRVAIVTYAGSSGVALPPTNGTRKDVIQQAIDGLRAEGSTNGGEGIQTAYDLAATNFIRGGVNRVVLMTDGDFNVGITDQSALTRLIEEKARTGVFLSVLGVGTGNVKDSMMERLADRGNGNYAYIDSLNEARKVLVEQMGGTLITVAKDVKLQVEFNPAQVSAYRLIGYEDRVLASSDFADDRRDAGDMGAGHTVTALFEVVPVGVEVNNFPGAGPLRYQQPEPPRSVPRVDSAVAQEMLNLRIRYKEPEGSESKLIDFPLVDRGQSFERASADFRFAAAVAEFGMMLRSSPHRGSSSWAATLSLARESRGADREGYREEFIRLVQLCEQLARSAAR